METTQIGATRSEARDLWRKYREHQHWSKPIDDEIRLAYQRIAQGKIIIRALQSVVDAGLGEDGLPKLAIARADARQCYFTHRSNGSADFAIDRLVPWHLRNTSTKMISFPDGSFPAPTKGFNGATAIVPLIPLHLRPKRGLPNYHILWEAEWRPRPPGDPMLLRRIGKADLWLVVAAWDLTDVERAALSTRVAS
jgi:hypothetical protein